MKINPTSSEFWVTEKWMDLWVRERIKIWINEKLMGSWVRD